MAKRVGLVGADSLMGRELRDLLAASAFDLRLIAGSEEETGRLTREGEEPMVIGGIESTELDDMAALLLAGSPESTRKALELAPADTALIDLTYAAEEHPRARLRAPLAEPEHSETPRGAVHVVAHPAAIAAALVLDRLHTEAALVRSLMHVFEPASERGRAGLEELQQQTVSLLSFKGLSKKVYDAQLGFNMLAAYGEEAPQALADAELRIERHLASLLALSDAAPPMPSLRLIQAPVFHGHSFSIWVEFEDNPGVKAVERALAGDLFDVRGEGLEPPNIVGMAGQPQIGVGAVALDRNQPQACWLWCAADNLRLAALNAVIVLRKALDE